jgi:biofilm PGA synthesis protein PgaA
VTAANARYYGNQLADAWARITRIADAAPTNASARMALYGIANARGWPRRAQAEGQIAVSLDPDSLDSKITLAEIAIANYRFAEAQRMVSDLLTQYPENLRVHRLARDLDAQLSWVFEFEAKPSDSRGGGENANGHSMDLQTKLTSPPIADNWQVFVLTNYADANPPEGYVDRTRLSEGIEWRFPHLTATLYPSQNFGTVSRPGGGATLDWAVSDQISLAFATEFFTWDTPLRALLEGITADEYATRATYRWDESHSLSGSFSYLPFTDGNQRFVAGVTYAEKVISLPHFDLTATGEAYASHNDRPNAPYYNPNSDLTVDGGLLAEHTIWRSYEDSWVEALLVNAGVYAEDGFGANAIATVSYEQRWRFDPLNEFHYGVELSRRVYDGSVENTLALTLGLRSRF